MTKKKSVEKKPSLAKHEFVPGLYIVEHEHGNLWGPFALKSLDDIPDSEEEILAFIRFLNH